MAPAQGLLYHGERAILATMHGKQRVIAPIMARFLGLQVDVTTGLETDAFGTFSRDIARTGSQLEAARAKIAAAFERASERKIGLASEGSFGPHRVIPFCTVNREIVVLLDRTTGLELAGHHATTDTNFGHAVVSDVAGGMIFAERIGFPDHGVIVMGCRDGRPAHDLALFKDIATVGDLTAALGGVIAMLGTAFVETDMRAHRNPRRMRAIKRATVDLVRRAKSLCPNCSRPGFAVTERLAGLPCSWCGDPTSLVRAEVLSCAGCGWRVERAFGTALAEPAHCAGCNP